ncbi:MAG: hypothetical protein R3D80_02920 [Paracoccaceae bacterium]
MYGYFLRVLPPRTAAIATALWFTALIVVTLLCSAEPSADFRYGRY